MNPLMPSAVQPKPISHFAGIINPFTILRPARPTPSRSWFKPFCNLKSNTNPPHDLPPKRATSAKAVEELAAETSQDQVTKLKPVLVRPARPTYQGLYYLSVNDTNMMFPLETLYSYKGNGMESRDKACEVIKNALAQVLVHFYPLAGKLAMSGDGKPVVNCTGEGVYFVEGFVEYDLDELGGITTPDPAKLAPFIYFHEANNILDLPLLTVQVTTFRCGGFIIGTRMNHCMMDGFSVGLFMNSWGEIARGLPLSVPPFLDRTLLKAKQVPFTELPQDLVSKLDDVFSKTSGTIFPKDEQMLYTSVHFPPEKLMQLKRKVIEEGIKRIPTNYELLTAFVWREVIRSTKLEQPRRTTLVLPSNGRTKFGGSIPKGYFGNCVWPAYIGSNTEDQLLESSLSSIVEQVQDAIQTVTTEYLQSLSSYVEAMGNHVPDNPFISSNGIRMPFYKADFGWGDPEQFGFPAIGPNGAFFLPQKKLDRNSLTAILSLPSSAMESFKKSMN